MVVDYCHVNRMVVKGFVLFVTWIGLRWYLGNTPTLTPQRVQRSVQHSHSDVAFRSVASLLEVQTRMPGSHVNATNTADSNAVSIAAQLLPFDRSVSSGSTTSESSIPAPTSSVYPRSCADWNCSCQVISNKFCVRPGYWNNARHQEPVRTWWIRNHCETHPDFPSVICASSKVRLWDRLEIVRMIM